MIHLARSVRVWVVAASVALPALAPGPVGAAPAPAAAPAVTAALPDDLAPDPADVDARARLAARRLVVDCDGCDGPVVVPADAATMRIAGEFDAPTRIAATDPFLAGAWEHGRLATSDAWAAGGDGDGVVIAVLDTGVAPVAELDGRLSPGWDTTTDQPLTEPSDPHGHGTLVAVTAAGAYGNGVASAGAAPRATILPVRVMFADGTGYASDLAEGVRWAVDQGADVLNLSVTGGHLQALEDAVAYARDRGVPVVAAAGNDAETANTVGYPAAYDHAVAVGAIDSDGSRAAFSVYGPHLDLTAPGVYLTSTEADGTVVGWSGTSAATPLVAGALAGAFSASGFAGAAATDVDAVAGWLRSSVVDAGPVGFDDEYGHGVVRMPDLVATARAALDGSGAPAPAPGALDVWAEGTEQRTLSHTISSALFSGQRAVAAVLCRDDNVADCLAVSGGLTPFTALLLTAGGPSATLPADVEAALADVVPPGAPVTVVGGPMAVSTATFDRLGALGYATRRVSGPERFATAVAIRDAMRPGVSEVLLVRGDNWADAITAGAYAADRGVPVLLTATGFLPGSTADSLAGDRVTIVGGTAAVSESVRSAAAARASGVARVWGPDRAATAAAVATDLWGRTARGSADVWTFVDIYRSWQAPLAAAQLAAAHDAPQLAVGPNGPLGATTDLLRGLGYSSGSPAAGHAVGRAANHQDALRGLVSPSG